MRFACSLILLAMMPSPLDAQTASESTAALGLEVLRKAVPAGENAVISPYSIQSALVMAYAGAAGTTAEQMKSTLHYGPDALASFSKLRGEIANAGPKDGELEVADRLFGQSGYPFRPEFLELLKAKFAAPFEVVDFESDPAAAARTINAWVEQQTRSRIKDLVPETALDELTRLVLVNAIYLKAQWAQAFEPSATASGPFQLGGGKSVEVPMMSKTARFGYSREKGFTAVSLPYLGGALEFVVLLPDGELDSLLTALRPDDLARLCELPSKEVALSLPKFRVEPPLLRLGQALSALGMPSAFNTPKGSADFSGIAPRKPDDYLYISEVFHKAFVEIDENGTEAAAATAVVMMRATMAPSDEPAQVVVDRPFLFAINHPESKTCLFLGRVTNPTK